MTAERDVCPHPDSIPIWVTVTPEDALTWSELDDAARDLGGYAAVLHGDGPSVVSRLDALHRRGVRNVVLAAVTVSGGRVPRAFLGRVARWWLADRASEMTVRVARETTHGIPTTAPTADASRTLRPDPSGLSSVAWEGVPPSAHHVLVCRGPRCSARGAGDVAAAIGEALQHRGLADADVLLTQTGCLYPCHRAPVVAIQPEMRWAGPVTPEPARALVDAVASAPRAGRAQTRSVEMALHEVVGLEGPADDDDGGLS